MIFGFFSLLCATIGWIIIGLNVLFFKKKIFDKISLIIFILGVIGCWGAYIERWFCSL